MSKKGKPVRKKWNITEKRARETLERHNCEFLRFEENHTKLVFYSLDDPEKKERWIPINFGDFITITPI